MKEIKIEVSDKVYELLGDISVLSRTSISDIIAALIYEKINQITTKREEK